MCLTFADSSVKFSTVRVIGVAPKCALWKPRFIKGVDLCIDFMPNLFLGVSLHTVYGYGCVACDTSTNGSFPQGANFHALIGMAFMALGLEVPELPDQPGEAPVKAMERGLVYLAIAVNKLRNKQGMGHWRPWLPTITDEEAKASIEIIGCVSAYVLVKLAKRAR